MIHIQNSNKDIHSLVQDLTAAVEKHKFGVLHIHDLQGTMRNKGIDFTNACRILEICNPQFADAVLRKDMLVSLSLPCRITVFSEGGQTKVGTLLPSQLMSVFGHQEDQDFLDVAQKVETEILAIIAEAV